MTCSSRRGLPLMLGALLVVACADGGGRGGQGTGSTTISGGATGNGGETGGTASGGSSVSGGAGRSGSASSSMGGMGSGGNATGGNATGGNATGGNATGGNSSGGDPSHGSGSTASGGTAGTATGGRGGAGGAGNGGRTGGSGGTSTVGGADAGAGGTIGGGTTVAGGTAASGGRTGTGGNATGGTATTGASGAGGSTHTGKWKIMPLGDSITDTTCYPKLLSQELISKGHTNFEFVGTSLNNQSCGTAPNVQTEGHGCYLVTNLLKDVTTVAGCGGTNGSLAELKSWAAEKPDVVLMEYGTNDAWSSIASQSILDAYSFVVDQFRGQNPSVIFFVAQITPLNPSSCSNCEANVEALNAKIPAWASGKSTTASPITVVNVWSSLPAATYTPNSSYTSDGCHPNQAGSQLMADKWYEGITARGIP